jgi:hypothetical protein
MRNFFRTLAPEQFDAKVEIHADGSYTYSYDGVLIFVPALIQAERGGSDAHMEAQLKEAAGQLLHEGFRKAEYLGRGRYAVILERSRAKGESSFFPSHEMKVFSIRPQSNGDIAIGGSRPCATAPCQLTGTDAQIDGTLIVALDKCINVLKHNAQSKPSAHGLFSEYEWHIKSPDADPFIIVRPAPSET